MKRIRRAWIDGVSGEDEDRDDERVDPCVPKRERFPSAQDGLRFPSFGKRSRGFCLRVPWCQRRRIEGGRRLEGGES